MCGTNGHTNNRAVLGHPRPTDVPLENLGVFLTQILGIISQLATSLTHGPHISTYTERYIRETAQQDDFTDMSIVKFLDTKHTLLKYHRPFFTSKILLG